METTLTIIKIFSGIGLIVTTYLIWHKFKGTPVACLGFSQRSCEKVQYSRQSRTLGISNSILGFLIYSAIMYTALMQPAMPFRIIEILVGVGFLFSLYFLYVQAFVLRRCARHPAIA